MVNQERAKEAVAENYFHFYTYELLLYKLCGQVVTLALSPGTDWNWTCTGHGQNMFTTNGDTSLLSAESNILLFFSIFGTVTLIKYNVADTAVLTLQRQDIASRVSAS